MAASVPCGQLAFLNPAGAPAGNIFAGLIYPIAVALMSVIIGGLFVRETFRNRIWDEVGGEEPPASVRREAAETGGALSG